MIKFMENEDLYLILPLYIKGLKNKTPKEIKSEDNAKADLLNNKVLIHFGNNNKINGMVVFSISDNVNLIFIHSLNNRRGIGSTLFRTVVDYGLRNNSKKVSIKFHLDNKRALGFFSKHGFVEESRLDDNGNMLLNGYIDSSKIPFF